MARGLSHRGLRRLPDRSPCPPRRDHRNRRRILPPQRSNRTLRETRASTPRSQTMIAEQPKSPTGPPLTINFKIPAYWTPGQALAGFELPYHRRDQRGVHYSVQLCELSREQPLNARTDQDDSKGDDQSF